MGSVVSPFVTGAVASGPSLASAAAVTASVSLAGAALVVFAVRETLNGPQVT